jgi:hypothetical protein
MLRARYGNDALATPRCRYIDQRPISDVMNRFDPTKAHSVPRSVALRNEVHAPQGITGESTRVGD